MIILTKHSFIRYSKTTLLFPATTIEYIHAVSLVCRNSQEGTRPLILRMAVGAGPLITGRLCLLINRNVLSGLRVFNLWAKDSA
jgi:hypothetical protein